MAKNHNQEPYEYEDELDRMRARRRKKSTSCSKNRRSESSGQPSKAAVSKKKKKRRGIFKFFLFLVLLSVVYLYGKRWIKDRDGYWNIAVFGVDSREGVLEKGALADVQMIASINKKTAEIRLVSVYRDTYVQINDEGEFHKINEAYFKGGHEQALSTLKRNLDITVDDYATFNWKAVADAINILGGIDLELTDSEFQYINSFITATVEATGVYSFHLEHAGMNHLDGVQAVAYSRLRLMDTDFNRTERQRKVISLALEKAKHADFNTLRTVIGTVIPEISTSIGIEDVIPLAKNVKRYYFGQTGGFPFAKTTAIVSKRDCVIPMTLESNVILLHQFLFDQQDYQPSSSVKQISQLICEKTGIYEEGKAAGADKNLSGISANPPAVSKNAGTQAVLPPTQEAANETKAETQAAAETDAETEKTEEETTVEDTSAETNTTVQVNTAEDNTEKEGEAEIITESIAEAEPLPEETTLSQEQIMAGPGAAAPKEETTPHTKPAETSTEAYGPGF